MANLMPAIFWLWSEASLFAIAFHADSSEGCADTQLAIDSIVRKFMSVFIVFILRGWCPIAGAG